MASFVQRPRGNGPQSSQPQNIEDELKAAVSTIERTEADLKEHPALAACRKAADMVRKIHEAHAGESETLAKHIEQIGETFLDFCKDAADKVRKQRIMPEEMANKTADELMLMGREESERQARVARGLTAARDAIIGIDAKSPD
jgi:hypothetical protein